jgi:hypothetical protein
MNSDQEELSMARPTFEETKKFESMIIPRASGWYTRIENYSRASFLNNIIFEFFLRDADFDKVYRELIQVVKDSIADESIQFSEQLPKFKEVVEKYKGAFSKFCYCSRDVTSYLYSTFSGQKSIYDAGNNMTESNLFTMSEMLFPNVKQDLSKVEHPSELAGYVEMFKIVMYRNEHPTYNSITNNININVNLNLPQEVILEQTKVLLQNLQTKHNNTIDIRALVGKKDINSTFANYFYVYDHVQRGIPNSMIKAQIDKVQTDSSISVNTIKEHMLKMTELIKDRNFTNLTFS